MKSSALVIAAILVAATVASAYDITSAVRGKCKEQMREEKEKLQHCQQYMMRSAVQGDEVELADCGGCAGETTSNEDCCARECCRALQRMDEDCACQTVKALAQQMTSEMMMGTRKAVRELTERCGISQQCDNPRVGFV